MSTLAKYLTLYFNEANTNWFSRDSSHEILIKCPYLLFLGKS